MTIVSFSKTEGISVGPFMLNLQLRFGEGEASLS
jgi:hypothetical protein